MVVGHGTPPRVDAVNTDAERLAEGMAEHAEHPNWPCEHWGCDDVQRLLADAKQYFDDAEQAWAALRTFERQVLALANGLRGIDRTLNRRPAHGRAINKTKGG